MPRGLRIPTVFLYFYVVVAHSILTSGFVLFHDKDAFSLRTKRTLTCFRKSTFRPMKSAQFIPLLFGESSYYGEHPVIKKHNILSHIGKKVVLIVLTMFLPSFSTITLSSKVQGLPGAFHSRRESCMTKYYLANAIEEVVPFNTLEQNSIDPSINEPEITNTVWFELTQADKKVGRIEISLYGNALPKTSENFESLVTSGKFKGSSIYRVIDGFSIQGGDTERNVPGGKKGEGKSSFTNGEPFVRENFAIKHSVKGIVSMVNDRKLKNDSRFFITTKDDAGWADGRYVGFGRVTKGMDVVWKIESTPVRQPSNAPTVDVIITDCGVVSLN